MVQAIFVCINLYITLSINKSMVCAIEMQYIPLNGLKFDVISIFRYFAILHEKKINDFYYIMQVRENHIKDYMRSIYLIGLYCRVTLLWPHTVYLILGKH